MSCQIHQRKEREATSRGEINIFFLLLFLFALFWAIVPRKLTHLLLWSLIPLSGVTVFLLLGDVSADFPSRPSTCKIFSHRTRRAANSPLPLSGHLFFFLNLFRCWWVGPIKRETAGLAHPFFDPLGPSSFWQFSSPICFPLVFVLKKKKKKRKKLKTIKERKRNKNHGIHGVDTPLLKQG